MDHYALGIALVDDVLEIGGPATTGSTADLLTGVGVVVFTLLTWLLPADLVRQSPRLRAFAFPLLSFTFVPIVAVGTVIVRWDLSPSVAWWSVVNCVILWWVVRGLIQDSAEDEREDLVALQRIIKREEAEPLRDLEQPSGYEQRTLRSVEAELEEVKAELRFERECFPERVELAQVLRQLEEARAELARLRPAFGNVAKVAKVGPRRVRSRRR